MTMMKSGLIFGVALLAYIRSAHTSLEKVWLKDVTSRFSTDKRKFSDLDHPDELTFNLRRGSGDLTLNLKRNHDIDPNADIYFARRSKDGRSVLVKSPNFKKEDVAYYQDMENGAFMTVRCVKRAYGQCDRFINGNIQIGDRIYYLRSEETDATSRNLFEDPGILGKRYVLQYQPHIQNENSVEKKGKRDREKLRKYHCDLDLVSLLRDIRLNPYLFKDAANFNEKKVEQELTVLFRRLEGKHKQNHYPHSDDVLSSQNLLVSHNREATDKSRQLKKVYYVKVAVLIDSTIWNHYSAIEPSTNFFKKRGKVNSLISESYSHIMNGANMRYKRIQDSSISISVILSRFIIFKGKYDLGLRYATVFEAHGNKYIDSDNYYKDFIVWDEKTGKKSARNEDNLMLFTRYTLYKNTVQNIVSGSTIVGGVCEVGRRLSIVQESDYPFTSLGVAHELGHSLGSNHDGEKDSAACKVEDYFTMTPTEPKVDPDMPFSSNLGFFSNCSVEAFKRKLMNKVCVTRPGSFYDEQKYTNIVIKKPGEVYTNNDQCHVIVGHKSAYCGPDPLNSCYLKCTDPRTGRCMDKYFSAAEGTQCGENMLCIQVKCVPKGSK